MQNSKSNSLSTTFWLLQKTSMHIKPQENGSPPIVGELLGLTSKKHLGIESGHPEDHSVWILHRYLPGSRRQVHL